jgi:hypothetical protein
MRAVTDTRVSHDIQRHDRILVLARHEIEDDERLDMRLHRHGVVSRLEHEIGEQGVANGRAVDGEVHGYVAEVEGHDRGVGDVDCADHVGAVGEDFISSGEEFDGGYVETFEFVEACDKVSRAYRIVGWGLGVIYLSC